MAIRPGIVGSVASTYSDFCGANYNDFSNLVFRSNASVVNQITTSPAGSKVSGTDPTVSKGEQTNGDRLVYTTTAMGIRYNDNANWQPGRGAAADGGFVCSRGDGAAPLNQTVSSTGYGTTPAYSVRLDFYHNYPTSGVGGGVIATVGNGSSIGWPTWSLAISTAATTGIGTLRLYLSYNNNSNSAGDGTNTVNANHIATGAAGTDTGTSSSYVFSSSILINTWYRVGIMFYNATADTTSSQVNKVSGYFGLEQSGIALPNVFSNTCSYPYNHQPFTTGTNESPVGMGIGASISTTTPSTFVGGIKNVFIGRSRFW